MVYVRRGLAAGLVLVSAFGFGACSRPRSQHPSGATHPSGAPNAVSRPGCGPTDGPATGVTVLAGAASCESSAQNALAHVGIWSGDLSLGARIELDRNAGQLTICPSGEQSCKVVPGQLTVTSMDGATWSGKLTWTEPSGPRELSFVALDCPREHIVCG